MNLITIAGRIGQDATTKTVGDTTVTTFSVADDQKVKGEKVTTWWSCSLWGQRGEALAQYLTAGSSVTVFGTASYRQYEKDGEARVSAECRVSEIALQGGRQDSGGGTPRQNAQRATQRPASATAQAEEDFASDEIPFITNNSTF